MKDNNLQPIIQLGGVFKRFRSQRIFENLNLTLKSGVYVLKGKNGVGKSTLLKLIMGLEQPDKGDLSIVGINGKKKLFEANKFRVFLPDQPDFFENLTVSEIVNVLLEIRGLTVPEHQEQQINKWGIYELRSKKWKELSLGQRKRVFLCFSLLDSIPLWVLDEPSNGLDTVWVEQLADAIVSHGKENLVLFSSHDESFLQRVSPKILKLDRVEQMTTVSTV